MIVTKLLNDNQIKPKEKTETISKWILEKSISIDELISCAGSLKGPAKATSIEALECATKANPEIATLSCLEFITDTLTDKVPRIKWESARVIGNIAHLYPDKLEHAMKNLLINSEHQGTVVRWSAAFALCQILKLNTKLNCTLLPAIDAICKREEKTSIRKIYINAIKKK